MRSAFGVMALVVAALQGCSSQPEGVVTAHSSAAYAELDGAGDKYSSRIPVRLDIQWPQQTIPARFRTAYYEELVRALNSPMPKGFLAPVSGFRVSSEADTYRLQVEVFESTVNQEVDQEVQNCLLSASLISNVILYKNGKAVHRTLVFSEGEQRSYQCSMDDDSVSKTLRTAFEKSASTLNRQLLNFDAEQKLDLL